MKEVVWVIGASGAGKETFIKNVHNFPETLALLGWTGKKVVASYKSLEYVLQNGELRDEILPEVVELLDTADVVLIKWQYADSYAERPQRLKDLLPHSRHLIVILQAPIAQLTARKARKPWWDSPGREVQSVEHEQQMVKQCLERLQVHFESIVLSSADGESYGQLIM